MNFEIFEMYVLCIALLKIAHGSTMTLHSTDDDSKNLCTTYYAMHALLIKRFGS